MRKPLQSNLRLRCSMQIQRPLPRKRLISLTPLIDVVFILLLFFMLATSFVEWHAIGLNIPATESSISQDQESLVIRLTHDGRLYVNNDTVTLETLGDRILPVLARNAEQLILLQPDAEVSLQRIVTVLDRLAVVGGRNISLQRGEE